MPVNMLNDFNFPKWADMAIREPDPKTVCNFCNSVKVGHNLVNGPGVNICDECVALCSDIIAEKHAAFRKEVISSLTTLISNSSPHTSLSEASAAANTIFDAGYRRTNENGQ